MTVHHPTQARGGALRGRLPPEAQGPLVLAFSIWVAYAAFETWITVGAAGMAVVWAVLGLLVMLAMKTVLEHAPQGRITRLSIFVAAPVVAAFSQTLLDMGATQLVGRWLLADMPPFPPGAVISPLGVEFSFAFKISLRSYLWIFGFYSATLALLASTRQAFVAREEALAARLDAQGAELEALRLQVNPHFLFNAMNSVSALIMTGRHEQAEKMTIGLAGYYRSYLTATDTRFVELGEELEALAAIVDIEEVRVEHLRLEIDCSERLLEALVPGLILQPLIENAIKYGVAGAADPEPVQVRVREEAQRLLLEIESGVSNSPDQRGTGTGLANVRRRLDALFGDDGQLSISALNNRWLVALSLPLQFGNTLGLAPGPAGPSANGSS